MIASFEQLTPANPASPLRARSALAAPPMRLAVLEAGVAGVTGVHQCVRENISSLHACTRTCSGWKHPCYPCHPCYLIALDVRSEVRHA